MISSCQKEKGCFQCWLSIIRIFWYTMHCVIIYSRGFYMCSNFKLVLKVFQKFSKTMFDFITNVFLPRYRFWAPDTKHFSNAISSQTPKILICWQIYWEAYMCYQYDSNKVSIIIVASVFLKMTEIMFLAWNADIRKLTFWDFSTVYVSTYWAIHMLLTKYQPFVAFIFINMKTFEWQPVNPKIMILRFLHFLHCEVCRKQNRFFQEINRMPMC